MKTIARNFFLSGKSIPSVMITIIFGLFVYQGNARADTHSYKVKSLIPNAVNWTGVCKVTLKFADGSSLQKEIPYNQTAEWKSSSCLKEVTGSHYIPIFSSSSPIKGLYWLNECNGATYDVVQGSSQYEFSKK